MIERRMIEKTYAELEPGDCVWISGALLEVTVVKRPVRDRCRFEAKVIRSSHIVSYEIGKSVEFSGLAHCPVLTEAVHA